MAAPEKHPDELRELATRIAVEVRRDPAGAQARVAQQVGSTPEALRNRVGPAGNARSHRHGHPGTVL
ncbi:hypothetical protein ACFYE2_00115 [Kocuria sp. CPCC 205300]|uniref:hypothetical protein n=1 Tax=Kocuria sabuli TaxID=3071448 RepID=UPI0036DA2FAE